jgi:simple sugar transport system permease protein
VNKIAQFFKKLGLWFKNAGIAVGKWFKSLVVSMDSQPPKLLTLYKKDSTKSFLASLISIFAGILVGVVILIIITIFTPSVPLFDIWTGFKILIGGPLITGGSIDMSFGFNPQSLGNMLFRATPILMTGLSVAVAFKTGLFNIGAPGQYLMGTMGALLTAHALPEPLTGFIGWIISLLVGMLLGMIWGAIPGIFKAFLNINEVITSIMTNWMAAILVTWVFSDSALKNTIEGKTGYIYPTHYNNIASPTLGLDKLFAGSWADAGIFVAIILAIVVHIILNKTTFGFELKATGSNKSAAKYAGMNEKRNIVLSMAIAGGLAAAGSALYYLNGKTEFFWNVSTALPDEGFNGIPIALLASSNPLGVILSALFLSYIKISGTNLSGITSYNEHISSIIIAVIIYFAGFSKLLTDILNGNKKRKKITEPSLPQQPVAEAAGDTDISVADISEEETAVEEGDR